jgi:hypothetical protein
MAYGDLHTVPGEHDTADAGVSEYFSRFGKISNSKRYPRSVALTDTTIG